MPNKRSTTVLIPSVFSLTLYLKRVSQIAQAGLKPSILFQTPECWLSRSEPPGQPSIPLPLLSSNKVSEARPLWRTDYPLHRACVNEKAVPKVARVLPNPERHARHLPARKPQPTPEDGWLKEQEERSPLRSLPPAESLRTLSLCMLDNLERGGRARSGWLEPSPPVPACNPTLSSA